MGREETLFEGKVEEALKRVRAILEQTRNPRFAAEVSHTYEDKFLLAELLTRAAGAALLQALQPPALGRLREWAASRAVTLRLAAREECSFVREETRSVDGAVKYVSETRTADGEKTTRTDKLVTTVTEWIWGLELSWEVRAFRGTDPSDAVVLRERTGRIEIRTRTKEPPRPRSVVHPDVDVDLGWLLRTMDDAGRVGFSIDRTAKACHTPRRNPELEAAAVALAALQVWCRQVAVYLESFLSAQPDHALDRSALQASEVFVPVVPFFEEGLPGGVVPVDDLHALLEEQRRSLADKLAKIDHAFPKQGAFTAYEARLVVVLAHLHDVCERWVESVDAIEWMLRQQLVAAIGKEIGPADFGKLFDFHARKLFLPAYRPRPFSYAIRRPDHDPEGTLSLEAKVGAAMLEPVSTLVASSEATRPMTFALDASVRVSFLGERHVHAWVSHQFSGHRELALSLVARARQFSSFVLLVGRIASTDSFEPRFGVIVHNKDLLRIPLMLEAIPTPKEFRDAIESLSPEQQRFAKSFRAMQLESTLFAVCVLQIRPQLERLLRLPDDSLTKEIKLTQDLLGLFMEHQIPSDLLSYDGPEQAPVEVKIGRVREYVARMQQLIDDTKQKELAEAQEREAYRLAEMNRSPARAGAVPFGPGGPPAFGPPPGFGSLPAFAPPLPPPGMGAPPPPPMAPSAAAEASLPPRPQPAPPAQPSAGTLAPEPAAVAETPQTAGQPATAVGEDASDLTRLPALLDRRLEELDEDDAMRPTILDVGDVWSRTSQKSLLAAPASETLHASAQKAEREKAFDLIDALTKSGALEFERAALHVVIAATHCFDRTLVETIVQGNVNPLERVERSAVIVATTVHGRPAAELLAEDQRARFFAHAPRLLGEGAEGKGR